MFRKRRSGREQKTGYLHFQRVCDRMHAISSHDPAPEKRALYLKMASVWHQMARRLEKKD
jgi:hypothetical protein